VTASPPLRQLPPALLQAGVAIMASERQLGKADWLTQARRWNALSELQRQHYLKRAEAILREA